MDARVIDEFRSFDLELQEARAKIRHLESQFPAWRKRIENMHDLQVGKKLLEALQKLEVTDEKEKK